MRFLFYDKIIEIDKGKRIQAVKDVALNESFFTGHFPKKAIMPATLIIEAVAQVAGWLINYSYDFQVSAILSIIEGAKSYKNVSPGVQLLVEAELTATREEGSEACGRALINDMVIMSLERIVFVHYIPHDEEYIQGERERFKYMGGGYPRTFFTYSDM